jgi:hypothetical protein
MSTNRTINNGPEKSDLMFSLFDRKEVKFHIQTRPDSQMFKHHKVKVLGIMMEDGSGNNWIIQMTDSDGMKFNCYYNSSRRKGVVLPNKEMSITDKKTFNIVKKF